jgi:hypothetical protein
VAVEAKRASFLDQLRDADLENVVSYVGVQWELPGAVGARRDRSHGLERGARTLPYRDAVYRMLDV